MSHYTLLHSLYITIICIIKVICIISHLGKMIFSLGSREAKSLKVLNLTDGGWRKGLAPKLNSHCWYDIKLAAAKKPDLSRHRMKQQKNGQIKGTTGGPLKIEVSDYLRGWGEDLFLWWQLMSIQIEDHLLLAKVQQEPNGVPCTGQKRNSRVQSCPVFITIINGRKVRVILWPKHWC